MKQIVIVLCLLSMMSCGYFNKKKVNTEDLLEEELKTFTWHEVDEYPSFASCDFTSGKAKKKHCFEQTLREVLNRNLEQQTIIVSQAIEDTVHLKITIDNKGTFLINTIESSDLTQHEIPQLDSLLRSSFEALPKIYPAIKRSQQVTTQFTLPVVIKIE